jgi:hypothetical protein
MIVQEIPHIQHQRILRIIAYSVIITIASFAVYLISYVIYWHYWSYEFYTVTKVVGKYQDPIYLSFHWKTLHEVMTGRPVEVWIESQLPYNSTESLKKIEIKFEGIGHFNKASDNYFDRISTAENVTLSAENGNQKLFRSDTIKIRYADEGKKDILFCDYNVQPACTEIPDIIEVAPHSTAFHIETTEYSIEGTIAVLVLTVVLILVTLKIYQEKR